MPIAASLKHHYRTPEWRDARQRALVRAAHCCVDCGKPDHEWIYTVTRAPSAEMWWSHGRTGRIWRDQRGVLVPFRPMSSEVRRIFSLVSVAHANHDPTDNSDGNLRVWCSWHHLKHDADHHRETREGRKDRARPIISEASA